MNTLVRKSFSLHREWLKQFDRLLVKQAGRCVFMSHPPCGVFRHWTLGYIYFGEERANCHPQSRSCLLVCLNPKSGWSRDRTTRAPPAARSPTAFDEGSQSPSRCHRSSLILGKNSFVRRLCKCRLCRTRNHLGPLRPCSAGEVQLLHNLHTAPHFKNVQALVQKVATLIFGRTEGTL